MESHQSEQRTRIFVRIHSDICNMAQYLFPSVRLQIRFKKGRSNLYLTNKDAESKVVFNFLDARLYAKRVRPNPTLTLTNNATFAKGVLARYNITRVALKTFTFSAGTESLSIGNAVFGPIPKRLLFTMVKNTGYLGSVNTNPYQFHHYDLSYFALNENG